MKWRPLVVLVLGIIFAGSLYLGISLQREAQANQIDPDLFVQQLNAGAFVSLEQRGGQSLGETASGAILVATFAEGDTLHGLVAAGADERLAAELLVDSEPAGVRLARQLLWFGPVLLLVCLLFIAWQGDKIRTVV